MQVVVICNFVGRINSDTGVLSGFFLCFLRIYKYKQTYWLKASYYNYNFQIWYQIQITPNLVPPSSPLLKLGWDHSPQLRYKPSLWNSTPVLVAARMTLGMRCWYTWQWVFSTPQPQKVPGFLVPAHSPGQHCRRRNRVPTSTAQGWMEIWEKPPGLKQEALACLYNDDGEGQAGSNWENHQIF